MTYEEAMLSVKKTGPAHAEGLPLLAIAITSLRDSGHAINPALWFEAAKKLGLNTVQVLSISQKDPARWGFLPWEADLPSYVWDANRKGK